jgi:type I restriction enzyme R subunit
MSRNEAETRAELIDPALAGWGWATSADTRVAREYNITPGRIVGAGQPRKGMILDYLLEHRGRKVAVLEAKAESKPLTEGLAQAKQYATKLGVRFAYCTNGLGYYEVDMKSGAEAEIDALPTPEEIWQRVHAGEPELASSLAAIAIDTQGGLYEPRYYQQAAIAAVLDAIAEGRDRVLLTLATGTGKTFVASQIAWKLFQARWTPDPEVKRLPRILFLADRNILANQAYNAFGAFDEDALLRMTPKQIAKLGSVPKSASVFFTIFQTFMSGTDDDGEKAPRFTDYPKDFFDLVIVDECHRGGAADESQWRGILEFFSSAVQIGLTATPRRDENIDTYDYFGDPVYVYSLKDGINDGYLTPFRVKQISTTLDEYQYSKADEVLAGEISPEYIYREKDFNSRIKIRAREAARVRVFMEEANPNDKTLVFCRDQAHALEVRDIINQLKKVPDPNYCHRVTADDGDIGDGWLLAFQDNDKTIPTILTTSEKLSTGVDALNVRNIVLLRPINSMIEFKQIIGRGTRLFDGKDYFTVYDFVKAHQHFSDPEWDGDPEPPEGPTAGPGAGPREGRDPKPRPEKVVVKLGAGRELEIDYMIATTFWGPNGEQVTAAEFLKLLFGELPNFYKDENDLRRIWSDPLTRIELLTKLDQSGFARADLQKIQELIAAEDSDLYDVLAFVSFNTARKTREDRAELARRRISVGTEERARDFIEFVLRHYVETGVQELGPDRVSPLIELKYGTLAEGLSALKMDAAQAREAFLSFQRHLYSEQGTS